MSDTPQALSADTPESVAVLTETAFYPTPAHGWTCFHCGETFIDFSHAREHFGFDPSADPGCRIKLGSERGLLSALRKAEKECAEAWFAIHNETTDAAKAYYAASARHQDQLRTAEEAGYERGLRDGTEEQAAEIARLTAEVKARKSNAHDWEDACASTLNLMREWKARATQAEAALAAERAQARAMREALEHAAAWNEAEASMCDRQAEGFKGRDGDRMMRHRCEAAADAHRKAARQIRALAKARTAGLVPEGEG